MHVIVARLVPQPRHAAELESRLAVLAGVAAQSSGALQYDVHTDADGAYLVYESYPTAEARSRHLSHPLVAEFLEQLPALLLEAPRVELGTLIEPGTRPAGALS